MILTRRCKLCGQKLSVNGVSGMHSKEMEHLHTAHPEAEAKYYEIGKQIRQKIEEQKALEESRSFFIKE